MDQNGPFWPEEVHFGAFRSANRTLAISDQLRLQGRNARGGAQLRGPQVVKVSG